MHLGWEKTLDKAYDFYWFANMSKYVSRIFESSLKTALLVKCQRLLPVKFKLAFIQYQK